MMRPFALEITAGDFALAAGHCRIVKSVSRHFETHALAFTNPDTRGRAVEIPSDGEDRSRERPTLPVPVKGEA
jgi:hypothetical protein